MRTDLERKKNALKLLAILRQAKPDQETAAAYLLDLQAIPPDVLEQACQDLGRQPRSEYQTAWPDAGTIRARCEAIMRCRREQKAYNTLQLTDGQKPVTKEQFDGILAKIRQVTKAKVMR